MLSVFISYTHDDPDHMAAVLSLADRFRDGAINCWIDEYVEAPVRGWPNWCLEQVEQSEFVLVVCSETYHRRFHGNEQANRGLGGIWEGFVITQQLYESQMHNDKFIPVLMKSVDAAFIPTFLKGFTRYDLSGPADYERLYRRLLKQPWITVPPLGEKIELPQRQHAAGSSWSGAEKHNAEKQKSRPVHQNLPFPRNHFFTGREEMLDLLGRTLHATGAAAVSGLAGQGKTQIALEYAYRHTNEYSSILWVRADSPEALRFWIRRPRVHAEPARGNIDR